MNKGILFLALIALGGLLAYRAFHQSPPTNEVVPPAPVSFSGEHSTVMKTNAWFSSIYKGFPTAPMFALPGAYKLDETGLTVSFPDTVGTPNTVFGSFDPLCSLGMTGKTTAAKLIRYGDWDAVFEVESGSTPWQVHIAQGSPITTINHFQGELQVNCQNGVMASPVAGGILLTRGTERLLIQAKGIASLTPADATGTKFQLLSPEQSYRTIVLPQTTEKSVEFFAGMAWTTVSDTRMVSREHAGSIETTYALETFDNQPTLMTLWPHHRLGDREQSVEVLGTYETVLGTFRLVRAQSFTTTAALPDLDFSFTPVTHPIAVETIKSALREDVISLKAATPPAGVYFLGTWLGGVASAAQIAALYGMKDEQEELLDILQNNLISSAKNFTYREDLKMLVAKNTEFGNDQGNDHHFHYGYYLRAAAVLATLRPEMKDQLTPTMNELVGDIATTDRTSSRYPYIRNFSPYDGHSWADGYASFGDGNNQESTSEALNAWYGVSLWGQVTRNTDLQKTGRALFATELSATKAYWFAENNPFPAGYTHTIASMVWGGKRDYATWFSGQAMHIHGIQWLPITPASSYLATLPNFEGRQQEIIKAHPNPATHEWGDLYAAQLSYFNPDEAERLLDMAVKNQAIKSTALLYQTVYQNREAKR